MNGPNLERFVNAIASDLEEGGFREVTGTRLRRNLATAVEAALPMLSTQNGGSALSAHPSSGGQGDRAQFDAWMKSAGCYSCYGFNRIENMWEAWQAALAFQPAGQEPVAWVNGRHLDDCIAIPMIESNDNAAVLQPRNMAASSRPDGYADTPLYRAPVHGLMLERYDAGLLSDVGGGDTTWWLNYLRSELGRAHDHYQHQVNPAKGAVHG